MRRIATALVIAASLIAGPSLSAGERLTGEAKLAKILAGREAGKPVDCLPFMAGSDVRVIDKTAIVYGKGRTIYVNRPMNARDLDDDDVMVVKLHTGRLCRLDTIHMHDRSSHFFTGFVGLENFVPYTRVADRH